MEPGQSEEPYNATRRDILTKLGAIPQGNSTIQTVQEFRGGEGFLYVLEVKTVQTDGTVVTNKIVEKNYVTLGSAKHRAENEVKRLRLLANNGINIPHIYGAERGAVYREYIDGREASTELNRMRRDTTAEGREELQTAVVNLSQVAQVLDRLGFRSTNFIYDLIYNPTERRFYQIDGGFDLGEPTGVPNDSARRFLIKTFPEFTPHIEKSYPEDEKVAA